MGVNPKPVEREPNTQKSSHDLSRLNWLVTSGLSGFPRECAGSPFGDRFLLILGLNLRARALLSSLRYAKRFLG